MRNLLENSFPRVRLAYSQLTIQTCHSHHRHMSNRKLCLPEFHARFPHPQPQIYIHVTRILPSIQRQKIYFSHKRHSTSTLNPLSSWSKTFRKSDVKHFASTSFSPLSFQTDLYHPLTPVILITLPNPAFIPRPLRISSILLSTQFFPNNHPSKLHSAAARVLPHFSPRNLLSRF
jgi:hypothetical protein